MNFQVLSNALVLAQKLHFTLAAEEISIVQPALSRQIKQLEEETGAILFKRSKRKVELTPAGRFFFKEVEDLLRHWEQLRKRSQEIHEGRSGELKIGFTHSIMQSVLPEILRHIREQVPQLRIILKEMSNREQNRALINKELDLSFLTHPLVPPGLKSKVLKEDYFALLLPLDHPVSKENFRDFSVFAEEEFIFPSRSDGNNYVNQIESICLDAGFFPKIKHETDSATSSFRLVEAGMGISLEPLSSRLNQCPAIKSIVLQDIPQRAELTMVWRQEFELTFAFLFDTLMRTIEQKGEKETLQS